jgi:murein DD-endopeptidase MepM/ murein hydrolase activator NlpD
MPELRTPPETRPPKFPPKGRRVPFSWLGFALLALGLAWGCAHQEAEEEEAPAAREVAADPEAYWRTWRDTVRRRDTLWEILNRHQVYQSDINRVVLGVDRRGPLDWRGLRPGQVLEGHHDELGRLRRLVYTRSPEEVFLLRLEGDSLLVERMEVPTETYWRHLQAVVRLTVDGALRRAGGDAALLQQLAEILSWDVDFYTDPRRGDTLDVLVEEVRLDGEFLRFGNVLRVVYHGERVRVEGTRFEVNGKAEYYDEKGRNLRKSFLKSPLKSYRITSRFSRRRLHPILRVVRPHLGVDYAAPRGTPVVCVGDGTVVSAGWNGGFGRWVKVRHSSSLTTTYGHLQRIAKGIRPGARVRQGQVIGYVGSSGLATGPHLDFRVYRNGQPVDPLRLKNPPAPPVPAELAENFRRRREEVARIMASLRPGERCPVPQDGILAAQDGGRAETASP